MTDSSQLMTVSGNELRAAFYKSGYFKDLSNEAQAIVKIQAGDELGLGPFASMQGIDIIQGKPRLAAGTQAALIKKTGRYNWKVLEHTDKACELEFYEKWGDSWEAIGKSRFTIEEASNAGLTGKSVWKQYPKNMLFARALSNAAKWYCPDVFSGAVYNESDDLGEFKAVEVDNRVVEQLKNQVREESKPASRASEASATSTEEPAAAETIVEPTSKLAVATEAVKEVFPGSIEIDVKEVIGSFAACMTLDELKETKNVVKDHIKEFSLDQQEEIKEAFKQRQKEIKNEQGNS